MNTPILPYNVVVDPSKLSKVKHSRTITIPADGNQPETTEKTSVEIPIVPLQANRQEFLYVIMSFRRAVTTMNWTTGPTLFDKFIQHLQGTDLQNWSIIIHGVNRTVVNFWNCIEELKRRRFPEDAYDQHREAMLLWKKPRNASPQQHQTVMEFHNMLLAELPGAPNANPGLTELEKRRLFFHSMPESWQNKFIDANLTPNNTSLPEMADYFERQAAKDPYNPRNNQSNRNNNSNNRNNQRNQRNNRSRSSNSKPRDSDPCPVEGHIGHTWADCRARANGQVDDYGNRRMQTRNSSNNNNNNSRNNQRNSNNNSGGHRYNLRSRNNQARNNNDSHVNETSNEHDSRSPSRSRSPPRDENLLIDNDNFLIEAPDAQAENDPEFFLIAASDPETPEATEPGNNIVFRSPDKSDPTEPIFDLISKDLAPITIAVCKQINEHTGRFILKALFDSGSTMAAMINRRALPQNIKVAALEKMVHVNTTQGTLNASESVTLSKIYLPAFSGTRYIGKTEALVFDAPNVRYDVIFGRSFLRQLGMILDFNTLSVTWKDFGTIPFQSPSSFNDAEYVKQMLHYHPAKVQQSIENGALADSYAQHTSIKVAPSNYYKANLRDICNKQTHLTITQQEQLYGILQKYENTVFTGKVGTYPKKEFHIELSKDAKPFYLDRPYSIPSYNLEVTKQELDRQEQEGIIEKCYEPTQWCMGFFVIPKANGTIRTIHDFRPLNRWVIRKRYLMPTIDQILLRRRKFRFATKIDVSMQYYTFVLDKESSNLCVFSTPFGKYRFKRLPMGFVMSSDWAQAAMEETLQDILSKIECYMDDILCTDKDWDNHLVHIDTILDRLASSGFTVNPEKCTWAASEVEFLGFQLTPDGPKPQKKRIEPILAMAPPDTPTQLRAFIGMVNFYRVFWQSRAEIMAPLTAITNKSKKDFKKSFGEKELKAFNAIKAIVAREVLLSYPDPNHPFEIFTDASEYQLGGVIKQHDKPIAFYSRKLTEPQRKYSVPEKELLSILEILEHYRDLLWGNEIIIHCDHKNLSSATSSFRSQRVRLWRLLVEDFSPQFIYYPGEKNIEADTISRHPILAREENAEPLDDKAIDAHLADLFINLPELTYPIDFGIIRQHQQADKSLLRKVQDNPNQFQYKTFGGLDLICRLDRNKEPKIVLTKDLEHPTIEWYHEMLGHTGITRLIKTISNHLYFPDYDKKCKDFVTTCDACQRFKDPGPGHGELPERQDTANPFDEVAVDVTGPWKVPVQNIGHIVFHCLTCIDTATTLCEIARIEDTTSQTVSDRFNQIWLSRYPAPTRCIYDQGTEFTGPEFQSLLIVRNIKAVPITVKNPQANAICERMHHTMGDILRTIVNDRAPINIPQAWDLIDNVIARVMHALRATVHRTLNISPGALVFHRDMLLPIPIIADFEQLRERRQALIDWNAARENLRRRYKDYEVGDEVMILTDSRSKLQPRSEGPYTVEQVHANGTLTIRLNDNVYQRINIRRLRPYYRRA